jgi:lipopolysaccharide export system protein LptA
MGIKLEFVLIIAIVGIIVGSLMLKIRNAPVPTQVLTKEVEFINTILIEVDTENMKSRAYATYGVRDQGVLTLDNIVYLGETIESLSANKARLKGDFLHLDGDVVLQERGGYKYETQHAIYNKKTEILNITSPFVGVKGQNIVQGESMEYNTREKKATGTTVGTVFYTPDK